MSVDIFEDLPTVVDAPEPTEPTEPTEPATDAPDDDDHAETVEVDNREVLASVPDGAVSVTDFAAAVTMANMSRHAADPVAYPNTGKLYVVPTAVYQAVRGQQNPLPHVLVQGPDDKSPKIYILRDAALAAWEQRVERNATRGGGGNTSGSKRSAEDLLKLLAEKRAKELWAISRREIWTERATQATTLVGKYRGWLSEAGVSETEVEATLANADADFNTAQNAKKVARQRNKSTEGTEDNA